MAAIDKIYGNKKQWQQLHDWLEGIYPEFLIYMYAKPIDTVGPIANFPVEVDKIIYTNCTFDWLKVRLEEQYGRNPNF